MNERLLERLAALLEAAQGIEGKVKSSGRRLDPLAVAKALVAIDRMAEKLSGIDEDLQPGLFPGDEQEN